MVVVVMKVKPGARRGATMKMAGRGCVVVVMAVKTGARHGANVYMAVPGVLQGHQAACVSLVEGPDDPRDIKYAHIM